MNVASWLRDLGLAQYVDDFAANDVDTRTLVQLTDADLNSIGVKSVGHRRRLKLAIAGLAVSAEDEPVVPAARASLLPAEHRQISVIYCDLVGSTALSGHLDPEDYRELIRTFHHACLQQVAEFDGWVANFLGDCVLAYFGWPRAHEDDAERAVRAGLAMVRAVPGLVVPGGAALAVRVGIATSSVVVGDLVREGPAQEHSAIGVAPSLGARLQALAAPGQVVIDEATRRLLVGSFELQPFDHHGLKGLGDPVVAHVISGERPVDSRFDAQRGRNLSSMVGRDHELASLLARWEQARAGEGRAVMLVGDAGIGKSRLVRAMLDACAGEPHGLVRWQCSPYHTGSALWPVIQRLGRTAGLHDEDGGEAALDKLEAVVGRRAEAAGLYAALLGLDGQQRYGPLQMTPQTQRERTLEVIVEDIYSRTEQQPLLVVLEDAHWIDPTTLELVVRCLERIDRAQLMIVITSRPATDQPAAERSVPLVLAANPGIVWLFLNRLSRSGVAAIVAGLGGQQLHAQTLATIEQRSDGIPLFVEELTKAVLEAGEAAIPASLQGSLMARLDRLPEVKEVAQTAACVGREFDLQLLQAVVERPQAVAPAVEQLIAAELIFPGADRSKSRYRFKHALVQEAAYHSLLFGRRQQLHGRILNALEADPIGVPAELLAYHASRAENPAKAIDYWQQAAEAAFRKSAYHEAADHYRHAIETIGQRGSDDRREAVMQLRLGQALSAVNGYGAATTKAAYGRASVLCAAVPDKHLRLLMFYGVWSGQYVSAQFKKSMRLAEQFLATIADDDRDDASRLIALRLSGMSHLMLGQLTAGRHSLEQSLAIYDPDRHGNLVSQIGMDSGSGACCYLAWALGLLGFTRQAQLLLERAGQLGSSVTDVNARAGLHFKTAVPAMCWRDVATVEHHADSLAALAKQNRLPLWAAEATLLQAWTSLERNRPNEAIERYERGISEFERTGARMLIPFFVSGMARALAAVGHTEEAWRAIERAIVEADQSGEAWCTAEIWRVRGELLLQRSSPDHAEAERSFEHALSVARMQGGRLWELRAATSLARLWSQHGKRREARDLLATTCGAFTEGFEANDLVDAHGLLESLHDK